MTQEARGARAQGGLDTPAPVARPLARALADPAGRAPLPLEARARLAPLLGRDVADVQVIRNAHASEATAAAAADALAVGNAVLLSPGQDLASPRGLGLLAHELTHVLRDRDPGFVPAVLRPGPQAGAQAARLDEETLAERVEGRVRERLSGQVRTGAGPSPAPLRPSGGPPPPPTPAGPPVGSWGGLPAPWEPMPFWDAPAGAPATPSVRQANLPAVPAPAAAPAWASAPAAPSGGGAPAVRAASVTRSVEGAGQAGSASGADPARAQALPVGSDHQRSRQQAPDLDRLAQQVYGLLKRRLGAEVRRGR